MARPRTRQPPHRRAAGCIRPCARAHYAWAQGSSSPRITERIEQEFFTEAADPLRRKGLVAFLCARVLQMRANCNTRISGCRQAPIAPAFVHAPLRVMRGRESARATSLHSSRPHTRVRAYALRGRARSPGPPPPLAPTPSCAPRIARARDSSALCRGFSLALHACAQDQQPPPSHHHHARAFFQRIALPLRQSCTKAAAIFWLFSRIAFGS